MREAGLSSHIWWAHSRSSLSSPRTPRCITCWNKSVVHPAPNPVSDTKHQNNVFRIKKKGSRGASTSTFEGGLWGSPFQRPYSSLSKSLDISVTCVLPIHIFTWIPVFLKLTYILGQPASWIYRFLMSISSLPGRVPVSQKMPLLILPTTLEDPQLRDGVTKFLCIFFTCPMSQTQQNKQPKKPEGLPCSFHYVTGWFKTA